MPDVQTPKFVIIKKIKTPPKAPTILWYIFPLKTDDIKQINIIDPQVKIIVWCIPRNKSVITNDITNAGIYFLPSKAGT